MKLECIGGSKDGEVLMVSDEVASGEALHRVIIRPGNSIKSLLSKVVELYQVGEDPKNYYNTVLWYVGVE